MSATKDTSERPAWFYEETHFIATGGVFDRATGTLLNAEGENQSAAVAISRQAMIDAEKQAADAEAASAGVIAAPVIPPVVKPPVKPSAATQSEKE